MVDTGTKSPTHRVCVASGRLRAAPETVLALQQGRLPKGNALPLAEAAGIAAVKKTADLLPLCHPLAIDAAHLRFEFEESAVRVVCEVRAHAKTGVEMEALSGVSAALLCLYDLTKGIDPVLEITDVRLLEKTGGKSGHWRHPNAETAAPNPGPVDQPWRGIRTWILTLSDRCARGEQVDRSGPALEKKVLSLGGTVIKTRILPDDSKTLTSTLEECLRAPGTLVLTTGGTGVGPRDITPDTLMAMGGKVIPGMGERMRRMGERHSLFAGLSRSEAFMWRENLLICLPGSEKGACESLDAISELVPHALQILQGGNHGDQNKGSKPGNSRGGNR
jgi:molybdenum cofactor biosynthesis protein MoaC